MAEAASPPEGARPRPGRAWIGLVALAALFALSRSYSGLRHDARLYFADALARLHPDVARDPIFVNDGQFGFSVFSSLATRLISALGVADASLALTVASLALWFAACVAVTRRLFADGPPERLWLARALVIAVPAYYGAARIFSYAEPFPTPRILAEALALAGLAACLGGRRLAALALFAVSALFHPIMALAGLGVFYLTLCLEDRRWLWAILPGAGAVLGAAALGLPLAARLFEVMDPQWRLIVEARSPHIFPTLWKPEAWSVVAVQAVTLAGAAMALKGAARNLMVAVLAAGLGGVAFALAFGDLASGVLVLQAQTWRALWLMAVFAAAGLAVCILEAPRRGAAAHLALAFLVMGWIDADSGWPSLAAAAAAVVAWFAGRRLRPGLEPLARRAVWALAGLVAIAWATREVMLLAQVVPTWPSDGPGLWTVWNTGLPGAVAAIAAVAWALRPGLKVPAPAASAGTLALVLAAVVLWDGRAPYARMVETADAPDLKRIIAARPGQVMWLSDDLEPWFVLHRASWVSRTQGAGVVFSRDLAVKMRERTWRLRTSGFAGDDWRTLYTYNPRPLPPKAQVDPFCQASDAPAWVIAPYRPGKVRPEDLGGRLWTAPASQVRLMGTPTTRHWSVVRTYAVIPCGKG